MASTAEIQARLTLNAKNFTSSFEGAIDQATARARAGGAQVGQAFSQTAGDGLRNFAGQVPVVGGALTGLNGAALGAAAGIGAVTVGSRARCRVEGHWQPNRPDQRPVARVRRGAGIGAGDWRRKHYFS
jgi:hypothetical protein